MSIKSSFSSAAAAVVFISAWYKTEIAISSFHGLQIHVMPFAVMGCAVQFRGPRACALNHYHQHPRSSPYFPGPVADPDAARSTHTRATRKTGGYTMAFEEECTCILATRMSRIGWTSSTGCSAWPARRYCIARTSRFPQA